MTETRQGANPVENGNPGIVQQPVAQFDYTSRAYVELLSSLKNRIQQAQVRAVVSVNRELVSLYWEIGRSILSSQQTAGWGTKVIDRLSDDLRRAFPESKGFSVRNLKYMRSIADAYPDKPFVQQAVAQIPWGHNVRLLELVKDERERLWYIQQTIEHGWSRAVLVHQIESNLYERQGKALTNFDRALPAPQSDLARELVKDPYTLDFLGITEDVSERELERSLLDHLREFLLELGKGFAFMGSQYHLEVGGQDYYLDLLFYNTILRAFVVIDLKVEAFKPEFAGKMNFYLNAVDELLRHPDDQPPVGLILCKERNRITVEFSLRGMDQPMGVSEYQLLPKNVRDALPTPEELEAELERVDEDVKE
jgi:predicted nuclease of restriction endonuclease-like (RecB) superfamily